MKKLLKIFILLVITVFISTIAQAADETKWTSETGLTRVQKIGNNILTKNNLPTQVTFTVMETDDINAFASGNNEICVYTGLLNFVENDDELAAVISHEMGHILNNHVAKQSIISTIISHLITSSNTTTQVKTGALIAHNLGILKMSRTQEYEADITGIDLITNANYNPLAMISLLYKISGNYIDFVSTHPSGDKRTMYSYNYILFNYPSKAKNDYSSNSYKQFLNYANPIIEKRNNSQSKLNKFEKEQKSIQEKRKKKLEKYKDTNDINGWNASYAFMQALYDN